MKIEQLYQLIRIVEEGSMNEAARKMYIARSSLSTSMKNLERELDGQIFSRNSKGICLTAFGAEVYRQACDICHKVDFLHSLPEKEGSIELSVSSMYCSLAFEGFVRFCKKYANRRISGFVTEYPLMEVIRQVEAGLAEIGFITLFFDGESITLKKLEEINVEFHKIIDRQLRVIVGENNPFYHRDIEEINVTELKDFPYIVNFGAGSEYSWTSFLEGRDKNRADIYVSDLACALRLIEETDGYMIETYDKDIYQSFYAAEKYKFIPLAGESMTCKLGWIKRQDRELSMAAEELIEIVMGIADK